MRQLQRRRGDVRVRLTELRGRRAALSAHHARYLMRGATEMCTGVLLGFRPWLGDRRGAQIWPRGMGRGYALDTDLGRQAGVGDGP